MSNKTKNALTKHSAPQVEQPLIRFPEFRLSQPWTTELGSDIFDQVNDKDHNSDLPVLAVTQEHGAIPRDTINYHVSVADSSIEGYKVVEVGDFIISLRSFQGGIEFSKYRGICSPAYVILRLKNGHSKEYFRHYLKTDRFIRQLTKNLEGLRDGKMISYKQFSELHLAIPSPEEQHCIADCLSSLDELIEAEAAKLDALKTQKLGLMTNLLPSETETAPRLRFPEFQNSGNWQVERLEDLAKRGSGHTPSKSQSEYYGGGIKWISLADSKRLDAGLIENTETEISPAGIRNSSAVLHPAGSVVLSRDAGVGKSAVMGVDMAVSQHFIVWTCKPDRLYNWFLYYSLQHRKPLFERIATGSTIKTIGLPFFVDMRLALPTLPEQKMVADCLASLDLRITAQARRVEALKSHKKGLMQQLFPALEGVQG